MAGANDAHINKGASGKHVADIPTNVVGRAIRETQLLTLGMVGKREYVALGSARHWVATNVAERYGGYLYGPSTRSASNAFFPG